MTGEMITAQQAQNIGFVSVVLKADEFKAGSHKILKSISEKPLSSLVEIKRLINKDASLSRGKQPRTATKVPKRELWELKRCGGVNE